MRDGDRVLIQSRNVLQQMQQGTSNAQTAVFLLLASRVPRAKSHLASTTGAITATISLFLSVDCKASLLCDSVVLSLSSYSPE